MFMYARTNPRLNILDTQYLVSHQHRQSQRLKNALKPDNQLIGTEQSPPQIPIGTYLCTRAQDGEDIVIDLNLDGDLDLQVHALLARPSPLLRARPDSTDLWGAPKMDTGEYPYE
ncbi:hypothetical protein EDD18DRAFT_1351894 [Armillaria luteobubalina]|uniref:Uncharacterized protein n=1 Tax=Armillaria luteobubalina TaxID=153913 RepID=A0AA39Q966_9AGAR|nr:hypothetical protein EDD18DRAFT_1351894 [Armillaria luteobubalina]